MRVKLIVFSLLLAALSFVQADENKAGLEFSLPKLVEGFYFENKRQYGDPRLGYGLNYRNRDGIFITVIVYDLGISGIMNGTEGPYVTAQHRRAQQDVGLGVEKGVYKSVTPLPNTVGFSSSFLNASYDIVRSDGATKRSHLFVRGQNNKFIKVRATGPATYTIDQKVSDFIDELLVHLTRKE